MPMKKVAQKNWLIHIVIKSIKRMVKHQFGKNSLKLAAPAIHVNVKRKYHNYR